jgi:hypothetical protein
MALLRLRKMDMVSYVRFASVYRQYTDVDQYRSELVRLAGSGRLNTRSGEGNAPAEGKTMDHDQNVSDMANEVLARQAKVRAERTGESLEEARSAVLETEAGRRLRNLREGPYRDERADEWQEGMAQERAEERAPE